MQKFYFLILSLSVFICFSAQEVRWQKDFPSSTQNFLLGMTSTVDQQILLFGSSINQNSTQSLAGTTINKGYEYHVIKLDQQGNKLWDKYFGGNRQDYLVSAVATHEGGFLLAGTSLSNQSGEKLSDNVGGSDVWLMRLDENGEELWQQTLGTTTNDEAASLAQSFDGGFFIAANTTFGKADGAQNFDSRDVFVTKLNKQGKPQFISIIGGSGFEEVQELLPTRDGGAVAVIYSATEKKEPRINNFSYTTTSPAISQYSDPVPISKSTDRAAVNILSNLSDITLDAPLKLHRKTDDGFGAGDYWVVKLSANGNIEWQKTYGGMADDLPKKIVPTEKGYLIVGESRSSSSGNKKGNIEKGSDLWLISIDDLGNEIWQKTFSIGNIDVAMSLDVIQKTDKNNLSKDEGFLIGGYTQAEERIQTEDEKFWILYLNADGTENWRKHIKGQSRKKEERLVSAILQRDGTYLLSGTSADKLGEENWKIIKLGSKELDNLVQKQEIKVFPNPVSDYTYVEIGFELNNNEVATLYVHDMSGRQMLAAKTNKQVTKINTSVFPQGMYIVSVNTISKTVNTKIVKK